MSERPAIRGFVVPAFGVSVEVEPEDEQSVRLWLTGESGRYKIVPVSRSVVVQIVLNNKTPLSALESERTLLLEAAKELMIESRHPV